MPSSLTIRGQKVSNRSQRRFLVVAVRPEPITITEADHALGRFGGRRAGTYVAFADVIRRSDSYSTARRFQESQVGRQGPGTMVVLVDSLTGEEI